MSIKLMTEVFYLDGLSPSEKLTLLALADNANDHGLCWPSLRTLAQKTCQSERNVRRVIRRLEAFGQVHSQFQIRGTTRYYVTPHQGELSDRKGGGQFVRADIAVSGGGGHGCPPNHQGTTKGLLEEDEKGDSEFWDDGEPWRC